MGATRLKILDLAAGDQPIQTDDGDTAIVFNGEIYNHLEIRTELERQGHRFHSHCDTETVLHAFVEWDTDAFSKLRGMFAVGLWTTSSRRLVLARDRMGIKPLYITRQGQDLLFGSELKAILVHPEIERRLSLAGLDCYLSLNYVPAPWTLVEGVQKLLPGHWLEWRDGQLCSEAYWRLPSEVSHHHTLDSAKEELDSLLKKAIPEHLLSDVPLGVWLSGGVDSTTILHYAAQGTSSRLKTFSISFRGRSFDETPYIKRAVEAYGTEHEQFDLNPGEDLEGAIEEIAYYSDEPSADAGALPVWFLSKLSKTRTTVALSGEGADELFGGYLTYPANRMARSMRKLPPAALRLALSAAQRWPASDEKIGLDYKLQRFFAGSLLPPEQAHVYWNGTFSEDEKRRLVNLLLPQAMDKMLGELRDALRDGDDLNACLRFDQKYYLPDDILVKSDRMSMAHAVEVRPAFLDHRIVEFASRLPAAMKIRGKHQKFLLKQLMKDKLPAAVLSRKKMGFDIPVHQWLRGPLRPLLMDTLHTGGSRYPDLFRQGVMDSLVDAHMHRKMNVGYNLWGLLILFLWMSHWRIQIPQRSRLDQLLQSQELGMHIS